MENAVYTEYIPSNISIYEHLEAESKNYLDLAAVRYYGIVISFREMLNKIEAVARALSAYGIKKDDVVCASLPGIPEGVYLIYAINKIGAKYCAFDCRAKASEILEMVSAFNPKICFIPDFQLSEARGITSCPVVCVDPAHSVGGIAAKSEGIRNFFTGRKQLLSSQKNLILWDGFISVSSQCSGTFLEKCSDNVFGYFYTSGTTYGRKSVIITNENILAAAAQIALSLKPGESILNIMPLFTCYSVTLAMHLPLSNGVCVNLIPLFNPKKLKKLLLRDKPNYIIGVPAHWEFFVKKPPRGDLSFLKAVIVGGDTIDQKYEDRINAAFAEGKSEARIMSGYGLSETTSSGAFFVGSRPKGSVGKPLINTKISIRDVNTGEILPPYSPGEICISGPTVCRGYYNEPELTKNLLQTHENGETWLHSGDIGYLDKDGFLFFSERQKRMYVRFDGTKISPYSIEQVISKSPLVERCLVLAVKDKTHTHGMCAKVLIVPRKGASQKNVKKLLKAYFVRELDEHMIPEEIELVDKLPYTKNGKLDYFMSNERK